MSNSWLVEEIGSETEMSDIEGNASVEELIETSGRDTKKLGTERSIEELGDTVGMLIATSASELLE